MIYTKEQLHELQNERLGELIDMAGNMSHLARMLNVPFPTVQGWRNAGRISKAGAQLVAEHEMLGGFFTATYLRPELEQG